VTFQKSKTSLTLSSVSFLKTYSFQLLEFSLLVFFRLSYTSLSLSRSPNRARSLTVAPCWYGLSLYAVCSVGWRGVTLGAPRCLCSISRAEQEASVSLTRHTRQPGRLISLVSLDCCITLRTQYRIVVVLASRSLC
jgi:hypothetical protein